MEMFSGAVITELVNRTISFLFTWGKKRPTATVEEDLQLLRRLLMRSDTIIEETERRDIVNLDMLQQLSALRDKAYTGYYILDTMRCQQALLAAAGGSSHGGGGGGEEEEEEEEKLRRRAFALSRFNPAKRVRFPSAGAPPEPSTSAAAAASSRELSQMVCSLEAMINGMDEFVVLLLSCPPLYHQPYSAHLYLDRCMFGRAMEKEAVIDFLLQSAGPPAGGNLGVLPIVGPTHIGKSTLVEHVCQDEKVRSHFFLISFYTGSSGGDLSDETEASFRAKCEIKHRNHAASEKKRWLVVVELVADVDEEAWARLYSGEARTAPRGSKMIVTIRSEKIGRFGTAPALRLRRLPVEAYTGIRSGRVPLEVTTRGSTRRWRHSLGDGGCDARIFHVRVHGGAPVQDELQHPELG